MEREILVRGKRQGSRGFEIPEVEQAWKARFESLRFVDDSSTLLYGEKGLNLSSIREICSHHGMSASSGNIQMGRYTPG